MLTDDIAHRGKVKELFTIKVESHIRAFFHLILIELVFICLTIGNGTIADSDSVGNLNITFIFSMPVIAYVFSLFWIFAISLKMPTNEGINTSANGFSVRAHLLADFLLLLVISLTIGLTMLLSNYLEIMLVDLLKQDSIIMGYTIWNAPSVFLANFLTMSIVAFSVGCLGYALHALYHASLPLFILLVAIVLLPINYYIDSLYGFLRNGIFSQEAFLFNLPFLGLSLLCIGLVYLLRDKREVKG